MRTQRLRRKDQSTDKSASDGLRDKDWEALIGFEKVEFMGLTEKSIFSGRLE